MNKIITKYEIKLFPMILSSILLLIIFKIDTIAPANTGIYLLKILSVPTLAVISLLISFGKEGLANIFSKPIKPFKNIALWYTVSIFFSFGSGLILTSVLHFNLQSNPGSKNLAQTFISLPFVLLFEEIISIFILVVIANFIYKKTKNLFLSQTIGVVSSCICFGLLHYSTYYNGSILTTLIHIIFVQGLARLFFNLSALKSNSIIVPWIIHVLFDFTTFGIGYLISLMLL
ncbi:hypothetical protein [Terrisporobacter petrolearius]|uniref:hypothetical protein n=1 Tax=Terrisporobacter petrolearius TaxID=1460447 RepID=UPI0031CC4FF6